MEKIVLWRHFFKGVLSIRNISLKKLKGSLLGILHSRQLIIAFLEINFCTSGRSSRGLRQHRTSRSMPWHPVPYQIE